MLENVSVSLGEWIAMLACVILGHVAMFLASKKVTPLFMLTTVILVLAPFSKAPGLAIGSVVFYLRAYALILAFLLGLYRLRMATLGGTSKLWMGLILFYICAAFWSAKPPDAILYKAQLGLMVLVGTFVALGTSSRAELIRGFRFLTVASGILATAVLGAFLFSTGDILTWGRVNLLGVLPTRMASNLAPLFPIAVYLALSERSRTWKALGYGASTTLGLAMIITASRGPAAAALISAVVLITFRSGGRARALALPVFIAGAIALFLTSFGDTIQAGRLLSTADTRTEIWSAALELIKDKPLFGHGWIFDAKNESTLNMHSIFMQMGVEAGLIGLTLLVSCLAVVCYRAWRMQRLLRRNRAYGYLAVLPLGILAAALIHALIENSVLSPSSFAVVLSLAIALIDHLPTLARRDRRRALKIVHAVAATRQYRGPERLPGSEPAT